MNKTETLIEKSEELKLVSFERQVELLNEISNAIAHAKDFKTITKNVLKKICDNTEFVIGQAWLRDSFKHKRLHFTAEYFKEKKYEQFSRRARKYKFKIGEGLPGLVWENNKYLWIDDIEFLDQYAPTSKRGEADIKTALAIPIPVGEKVLGAVILYLDKKWKEDHRYVKLMSTIMAQLGVYLMLVKSEERKFKKKEHELNEVIGNLEQFSYVISHDLKSPLQAIKSLTDLLNDLRQSEQEAEGKEMVQKIKETIIRMETMVNELLEFSRAGIPKTEKKIVAIDDLINRTNKEITTSFNAKIETKGPFPKIYYYSTLLRQVFTNLIKNAIQHNDKELPIIKIGSQKGIKTWRIYIKDNGPGIPKKLHNKIFQPFQAFDPNNRRSTGLGLAIVKKVIEKMGGKICVKSKTGKGTTFWITIPQEIIIDSK